jgi:neurotransmitter:Na+ symporter, NSS family
MTLFAGWVLTPAVAKAELTKGTAIGWFYPLWRFLIRYVSPVLVALVLLNKVGLF